MTSYFIRHLLSARSDVLLMSARVSGEEGICAVAVSGEVTAEVFREVPRADKVADDEQDTDDSDDDGDVEKEVRRLEGVRL